MDVGSRHLGGFFPWVWGMKMASGSTSHGVYGASGLGRAYKVGMWM